MQTVYYISVSSSDLSRKNKEDWPEECNGFIETNGKTIFTIHTESDKKNVESQLEDRDIEFETNSVEIDEEGSVYI